MKLGLMTLSIVCLAVLGGGVATSTAQASSKSEIIESIDSYITSTWHMQRVMGTSLTPTNRSYVKTKSNKYRKWVYRYWKRTNWKARLKFNSVPNEGSWYCIHKYEGSWSDPNSPYYGGLQMDLAFQRHYGPYLLRYKGTADNWTPLEQMWVAEKARRSGRGFYPWPNTARACGLI